jgi:hypothetical protein
VSRLLPPGPELQTSELSGGEELQVFRIVRTDDVDMPEFAESSRSHAALGLPPRGVEETHRLIYEGISVFESREAAGATARKYPRIGSYVAELRITPDTGVRYLRWGARGHLTLWGDPIKLSQTAVDTLFVEGAP